MELKKYDRRNIVIDYGIDNGWSDGEI